MLVLLSIVEVLCFLYTATLLVAINEIKKSAHEQGLSFYEYGMTRF